MTFTYLDYLEVITSLGIIKICKVRRYLKFHLLVKFLLITNSFVYIITEFYFFSILQYYKWYQLNG